MNATASMKFRIFKFIIITALGVFVFPITFYADNNPITSMPMTSEAAPLALTYSKDQSGWHSNFAEPDSGEIHQIATAERFPVSSGHAIKGDRSLSSSESDSTKWFSFSTDQILLAFGLIGFLSSRKRQTSVNRNPDIA